MSTTRRFPAPWRAVAISGGWRVEDATGRALAYVYASADPGLAGQGLTTDEARRIAAGMTRLPEGWG